MKHLFITTAFLIFSKISFGQVNYPSPVCHESLKSIGFVTECEHNSRYIGYIYNYEVILNVTCVTFDGQMSEFNKRKIDNKISQYFFESKREEAQKQCQDERNSTLELKRQLEKNE